MTNQQLKAHCEDVIANPQDHLDWVVSDEMAIAFHRALSDGALGSDELEEIKAGLRAALLNYAPPLPELKPIELPKTIQQHETCKYGLEPSDGYGLYWGSKEMLRQCIEAIRTAGYEVKL